MNKIKLKNNNLKGIIFDLGYSIDQIKNSKKGLSFTDKGKLDMRMGINDFSANDFISNMDENNLSRVFKIFGDERYSKKLLEKL